MSFSESGGVVTQTGTDNNLSGSASYATVTNHGAYQTYNFGSNRLVVEGTLKINVLDDGVKEQLVIGTGDQGEVDIEVASTGNLTVGYIGTANSESYVNAQHTASVVEKDINLDFGESRGKADAWNSQAPFLLVRGGGTFTWNGTMCICGGIAFDGNGNGGNTDSVIKFNQAVWDARTVSENSSFDQIIYSYTRDIEINGLTVIAISNVSKGIMFGQLATPFYAVKGYQGCFTYAAFSGSTTTPVGFQLTIEDYAGVLGNPSAEDFQVQGRTDTTTGHITILNSNKGSSFNISTSETDTQEELKCTQAVSGTYKTGVGGNVESFVVGTLDVNDLLYSDIGSGGSFDFSTDILLCKWAGGVGVSPMVKTNYSPSGSDDDLYDFYTYSYGYAPRSRMQVELRKIGGCILDFIGASDLNISESSKATVDAYTEIPTLDKLYDSAKSHKIANILIPDITKEEITAIGEILDLGDLDIDINTTGDVYDCTATKISVKVM